MTVVHVAGVLVTLAWLYLLTARGRFGEDGQMLDARPATAPAPSVAVIVPARDEAVLVGAAVGSLLAQDYPGALRVVLVDDGSTDGTADVARALPDPQARLAVVSAGERPPGWAGKLWAVSRGIEASGDAELLLLTDADIVHAPLHLAALVEHLRQSGRVMVSEMVRLNCTSPAERWLVPAFVYFFCLLYPFAWVNDPRRRTAAAAGGTILVRADALAQAGGIAAIRGALIDDVALARIVKPLGPIWLGHSRLARSIRPYPHAADIWRMVARSAYVQLDCSPLMLAATVLGMAFLFLMPVVNVVALPWIGLLALLWMLASATATWRRFGLSRFGALLLPLVACFYVAATLGSAWNHHRGRGVVWKQRAYG